MNRAQIVAWIGSVAMAAIAATPALARNPYAYNPYIYNGGVSYNPAAIYNNGYGGNSLGTNSADIDQRKNALAMQLNQGYAMRRIPPNEAQSVTVALNKLNVREMNYLNSDGGRLTNFQRLRLNGELDGLSLRLNKDMALGRVF